MRDPRRGIGDEGLGSRTGALNNKGFSPLRGYVKSILLFWEGPICYARSLIHCNNITNLLLKRQHKKNNYYNQAVLVARTLKRPGYMTAVGSLL